MQFGNIQAEKDVKISAIEGDNATIDNSITQMLPQEIQNAVSESNLSQQQQEEVSRAITDLQQQLAEKKPNEGLVKQLLRRVRDIAPDVIEVVLATFANPLAGLGVALDKLLD